MRFKEESFILKRLVIILSLLTCGSLGYAQDFPIATHKPQVSSHLPTSQYLRHRLSRSESPAFVLKKLNLFPILSRGGSLHHLYKLNPALLEYTEIPAHSDIILPITQAPAFDSASEFGWVVKNQRVQFFRQNPPSIARNSRSFVPDKSLRFGNPKLKMSVRKNSDLLAKFHALGIASSNDIHGNVELEIPLYKQRQRQRRRKKRSVASIKKEDLSKPESQIVTNNKAKKDEPQKWKIGVSTLFGVNNYSITDSLGVEAVLAAESLFGIQTNVNFQQSWINIDANLSVLQESIQQGSSSTINQESNNRIEFFVDQNFHFKGFRYGLGLGMANAPVVTGNGASLNFAYANNPFLQAKASYSFSIWKSFSHSLGGQFRSFLGTEKNGVTLNNGLGFASYISTSYKISKNLDLKFSVQGGLRHDNPDSYQQNLIELQILLGLSWDID